MGEHVHTDAEAAVARSAAKPAANAPAAASPRSRAPSAAAALGLQRAVGNRLASRVLSRWSPHPDKDKKGQFMSDQMAEDWNRFNPPLSK
jgi:hypothetical protein